MFQKNTYKSRSIRFKRWSRKGYAVFAGIHKVISIGTLIAGICEKSLEKSKKKISTIISRNLELFAFENDETDLEFSLNEIQLASIVTPSVSTSKNHQENIQLKYNIHKRLFIINV